eukprot:4229920-Prymnesium_polylepis.1
MPKRPVPLLPFGAALLHAPTPRSPRQRSAPRHQPQYASTCPYTPASTSPYTPTLHSHLTLPPYTPTFTPTLRSCCPSPAPRALAPCSLRQHAQDLSGQGHRSSTLYHCHYEATSSSQ